MNPWRWVQQTGEIEKETGIKINFRQFGGGGDVIRAMASGDVASWARVGSTGIATAISQGMDVELFWILEDIAVRRGAGSRGTAAVTNTDAVLKGKKGATPFVSTTTHFHLLYAMQKAGIKPSDAQILNMRPPEIAAAPGARRSRCDVPSGILVLADRQEGWQGVDDVGRHLQAGRVHVRRTGRRHAQIREGEPGRSSVAMVKAIAKADADYQRAMRRLADG